MKFTVRSDKGLVRENNEDNFYCNGVYMTSDEPFFLEGTAEPPCIFAVCDGMGGEECGEIASLLTVKTLSKYAERICYGTFREVEEFVKEANREVRSLKVGAGTTLAMVVIKEDSFMAYNLGDSRIYRVEDGRLLRITEDHTVAEEKVRMGLLTFRQAMKSRERNILTRYIGMPYDEFPDDYGPFYSEKILLCSDGLTDMLSHHEILENLGTALVDKALEKGGRDNITCIEIKKC